MKFLKLLLAQSLFFILLYSAANAQDATAVLNKMIANSATLYNGYPIEKVYLHLDKPYYALGDTIWFKAYLTVDNHMPSTLSKIIYVDVLGPRDTLMQSLKLQTKNGIAWSFIPLSQYTYKKGNYRIVAYTNWMNNSDLGYFFNKTVTIGDAINNNLSTNISLLSTVVSKSTKISANIFYRDDKGNPYSEKRVNWSVQKEDETIAKGKGVTDKNGFISISFVNIKKTSLDSANIITAIDNGNHKDLGSVFSLKPVAGPDDVQFFPEGGGLFEGVQTKVAFKAIRPNGLGVEVKGTIVDNNNAVVAEFTSQHLGMGVFEFTPEAGKTYTTKITCADGTVISPDLPKVQTGGINLSLDNSNPAVLGLKLMADASFLQEYKGKTFFILAKANGGICFAAKTVLTDLVYAASIPKNKFPTGVLQVTLFTSDGDPVTERIAFIQHNDQLNLALSSDKPSYTTRQKVKLNITAKNKDQQPDEGNFSITVIDDAKVPYDENAETTILTNLLLTSDIKGYIEKPNYYFNHPNEKTAADLDVLLQTQGYRRYSYDGVLDAKYPPINFPAEQGIDITGTLRASNGLAIFKGNVTLSIPDKNYYANSVTDADGKFKFTNLVFTDSTKVKLSARNNLHGSDLVLTLDGDHAQSIPISYSKPDEIVNIDSVLNPYLKNSKIQFNNTHTLKEVVIKDTKIVKTVSHKDYPSLSSLSSEPDHLIAGSQLNGCNSVLECLKTLAVGMTFDDQNFYVQRDFNAGKRVPAQVFVKGMPVDANYLISLNANDIESVEVFLKDELGLVNSANNTNGALVINMRKVETQKISLADLRAMLPQRNELTLMPKGYNAVRSFYLPRYDVPKAMQSTAVDTRSTIYWNPNINTDKTTGAASVEFFNADGTGTYRAIIEGIDKDGNIGRQLFRYEVK